jgi:hypothetical protein
VKEIWLALALLANAAATSPADRPDAAARMSNADSASEYWDLMARFDSDHRLVARFLVTNEGPGKHTAVAVGHLVFPDGRTVKFRNGRRRARWELDAEQLRLDIGSSLLDLRSPTRTFAYDSTKRGIKIHLSIEADAAGSAAEAKIPARYGVDLLDFSAHVEGTVWTRDMDAPIAVHGRASLTHTWMEQSESSIALRRFDFASLGEENALLFYDLTTPGGERARWLAIEKAGRILYESSDLEVSLRGEAPAWSEPAYPLPATLHFRNSEVNGRIELGRMLLRHDPMGDLPQPFRFLLSFKTRPRRVWAESPFEVKLEYGSDRSPLEVRGTGIASVTYLNPLRSPTPVSPQGTSGV